MKNGRVRNTIRNSVSGLVNKLVMMLFPFVIRTLMIQFMGVEYLGLNSLFTSILQVLSLAELGLSNAIVFSMYKPIAENNQEMVGALYNLIRKVYIVIGLVILCVGLIIIPFLPKLIAGDVPIDINLYVLYLLYLFNTVVSYFLFSYKECLLVAHQRSDVSTNISTIVYILMYFCQCVAIVLLRNYYWYILFLPVCTILLNIVRSIQVDRLFPSIKCTGKVDNQTLKELIKKVGGLMLYKISGVCRNAFDSIILSSFLGLAILAKYQNYYYIMNAVGSIIAIITTAATASIGNSIATETVEKNLDNFKTFSLLYNWIAGWCSVCLLCLYQPFMKIWLGKEFLFSFDIVILLCLYFYSCKVSDILFTYRQAAGLWWEDKLRPIIESIANLILNIIVVKYFGVCGVIVSTIVTIVFINIPWGSFILFKHYFKGGMKEYLKDTAFNCVIVIIASVVTFAICKMFKSDGIILLLERFVLCLIIPNILFYLAYFKSSYFNKSVNLIKRIIKK